ncbi:SLC13 family permease [Thermococcus sp. Bubb.Bath]|uniref:SLC13 family permease n=1 Tax=Thermococcus sp. Bubb.Bath TaxID=1638242 RepID=UPI00143C14E4|nr:SLC13 family permease [Thermococcus sp. Bubb.Bath]NJF26043.1 DUF1646 domain-containing protein [Thermococcus sp. Bubb.Bath]
MKRLKNFIRREWFLTVLLLLYSILVISDSNLLKRTPNLIDWESLSLITSLIMASKGLELSGIFSKLGPHIIRAANHSERRLVILFILTISLSSAVIMNDTAMLVFIPLVSITLEMAGVNTARAVTLSAIAANVGSSLTPVGNPQNVIIWHHYSLGFFEFIRTLLPYVTLWLALLLAFTMTVRDRKLSIETVPDTVLKKDLLAVSLISLVIDVSLAEVGKPLVAFLFTLIAFLALGRETLLKFDWALVLIFAFIFVDFNELALMLQRAGLNLPTSGVLLFLASAGLSQLVSNVPATVFLSSANPKWLPLALGVNVGGTGSIVGSLANLIAIRIAGVRIREFHRYSIPYFILALLLSLLLFLL